MKIRRSFFMASICLAALSAACQPVEGQTDEATYEEKSNQGDVSFRLSPRGIVDGRFVVDFRVDTHSGDLSEIDLGEAVTLEIGDVEYRAVEATSLQGHHAQGTLTFALAVAPRDFTIVIARVRDMGDLRFEWTS